MNTNGYLVRHSHVDGSIQIVVPSSLCQRIFRLSHHPPIAGQRDQVCVYDTLRSPFYCPRIATDTERIASKYQSCTRIHLTNHHKSKLSLFPHPALSTSLRWISTDQDGTQQVHPCPHGPLFHIKFYILGTFFETKQLSECILVTTKCCSHLTSAIPTSKMTSTHLANHFFAYWLVPYGIPTYLSIDNNVQLISKSPATLCISLDVKQITSTAYHSQSSGPAKE